MSFIQIFIIPTFLIFSKIKLGATGDPGEPLFLTPYIEENRIDEARKASQVFLDDFQNITSYSGYFTVNDLYDSNLFYWFFPSENDYNEDPVLVWLQGGPGTSSLFGLFIENGPFIVESGDKVKLREYRWTKTHSVIYIDSPAGTGFSFTNNGYAKNQTLIGEELHTALSQFFQLFPELQDNPLFITGESYAGKYVPALSYTIFKKNQNATQQINLQGLCIGNGFSDPYNQVIMEDELLYQLGLLDAPSRVIYHQSELLIRKYIDQGKWLDAYTEIYNLMVSKKSYFVNVTGINFNYNYLFADDPYEESVEIMTNFLQKSEIKTALHVGNNTYHERSLVVAVYLREDYLKSVTPLIVELLNNHRVLIYNGQLDLACPFSATENSLLRLDFNGANEYKIGERQIWRVDSKLAGYVKVAGNLTHVLVRNAGHYVPTDQPKWAYDLITKFIRDEPIVN